MLVRTWLAWFRSNIVFGRSGLKLYSPAGNVCVPTLKLNGIFTLENITANLATRHADRQHDEYAEDHLAHNVALSFHTSSLFTPGGLPGIRAKSAYGNLLSRPDGKQFGLHRPRLLRRETQCSHAGTPQFRSLPTKAHYPRERMSVRSQ